MKTFRGRVAVVTGGASGIGRGLAERCVQEGMHVVIADIEATALEKTRKGLEKAGGTVLAVHTDVSKAKDIEALAERTLAAFGGVHLLFNNAGVQTRMRVWENREADWQWVLGVNLWGVIHSLRTFVPIMLNQKQESHIVNTASGIGLVTPFPYTGTYAVSKHGVVALSETLYHELGEVSEQVKVSVLCPGTVQSRIQEAARNQPEALKQNSGEQVLSPEMTTRYAQMKAQVSARIQAGMSPEEAAEIIFKAIHQEHFYILTEPKWKIAIQMRMEDILLGRNPTHTMTAKKRALWTMVKSVLPIPRLRYLR